LSLIRNKRIVIDLKQFFINSFDVTLLKSIKEIRAMPLPAKEIELVEDVLQKFNMVRREDMIAGSKRFYQILFQREPKLRALFRDDLTGQGMKFMTTLQTIVAALKDKDLLNSRLKLLAEGHANLGIVASNFVPMGEALIDTFQEVLGSEFTPDMESATRKAFLEISRRMIEYGGIPVGK